jgi:predicted small secreted protein
LIKEFEMKKRFIAPAVMVAAGIMLAGCSDTDATVDVG